ncbi:MAG: UPF0758 domain-containing protein [Candidatus Odinarchaeia archaeon]
MKKIKDLPDIDKPREKIVNKGVSSLSDVELLAVIISKGFKGKDVLQVASEIEKEFKGELDKLEFKELNNIDGVGKAKACQILACFELARRYLLSCNIQNGIEM